MIEDFVTNIDASIIAYTRDIYEALADDLASSLWVIAALIFVVMVLNSMFQVKAISVMAYVGWHLRMIIIISMASSWTYFEPVYNALTALPDAISGAIIGGGNAYQALDAIVVKANELASYANEKSTFGISMTGVVLWVIAAILAAIGILTALVAKGGLALALGLAPVFIATLLSSATSDLFKNWAKTVIGFMTVMVVLSGMIALVTALFQDVLSNTDTKDGLQTWGEFLTVAIIAIMLMKQIPSIASSLSGSIVSGVSGIAVAAGIAGGVANAMKAASGSVKGSIASAKTGAAMGMAAGAAGGMMGGMKAAMAAHKTISDAANRGNPTRQKSNAASQLMKQIRASSSEN